MGAAELDSCCIGGVWKFWRRGLSLGLKYGIIWGVMNEIVSILIVEDDATIRTVLEMALAGAGYRHVRSVGRGDEGLSIIKQMKPDVVLLDIMLPGLDGFTICRRIREIPSLGGTRVIILTALTQRDEIVRGLESGADDYVTKPFDREILLARLHAVLRRGATMRMGEDFDGLRLEEENRLATLKEKRLKLSPGELKILAFLVSHRGRILGRAQILNAVQEEERGVTERTIDVQIATLRKKLGRWARHIETIRGIGYRVKV